MATSTVPGSRVSHDCRGTRILVAVLDDDSRERRLLCRTLAREGYAVVATSTREGAPAPAIDGGPSLLIVVDRSDGSVALRWCLRRCVPETSGLVVLRSAAGSEERARLLDAGADDVLEPACDPRELAARLRALLRRVRADGAPRLRFADLEADPVSGVVQRGERRVPLTARELQILLLFMRQPRRVVDRATILGEAWPGGDGSWNSVAVHVHHLRRKLHGEGERPLLHTVRHAGYVLTES